MGLPVYHPLIKDADKRLRELKASFDRYRGRYRRLTTNEANALNLPCWEPAFLPDLCPLGHPATPEEVQSGRAIFELQGRGKVVKLPLPAVAVFRSDATREYLPRVPIVQAEAGTDNEVTYGVIGTHEIRAVPAKELVNITPLEP